MTIKHIAAALAVASSLSLPAFSAEPIVGDWRTASGETVAIAKCGGGFCITLKTGKFSGNRIGTLSGSGTSYTGKITDPKTDKTYSGKAEISGKAMKVKGCVMKLLCKSQTWSRL